MKIAEKIIKEAVSRIDEGSIKLIAKKLEKDLDAIMDRLDKEILRSKENSNDEFTKQTNKVGGFIIEAMNELSRMARKA